ncbi:DUF1749-domain-containing protein, partial [Trichocladium antarcticum]
PPYPVLVHTYPAAASPATTTTTTQQVYEHLPPATPGHPPARNAVIFLGGLGDGPHTLPYTRALARALPAHGHTLFEARLSSAFAGFGHGSLAQDARELARLVRHVKRALGREIVVVMGHSTGCQGGMELATRWCEAGGGHGVDGFVLQGPVSDREAVRLVEEGAEVEGSLRVARGMVEVGRGGGVVSRAVMPAGWRGCPVTADRWCSLVGVGGADDYFSSDLDDATLEAIWGRLEQPVLILPSEKDEWVPPGVDVGGMVERWKSFCKPGIASELSGLIPGANHQVDDAAAQQWMVERVVGFLAEL